MLSALKRLLPCEQCARSYRRLHDRRLPPPTLTDTDPECFAKWLWSVKDVVNQKLGKESTLFSTVRARHVHFRSLTSDVVAIRLLSTLCASPIVDRAEACTFVTCLGVCGVGILDAAVCERLDQVTDWDACCATLSDLDRWYEVVR